MASLTGWVRQKFPTSTYSYSLAMLGAEQCACLRAFYIGLTWQLAPARAASPNSSISRRAPPAD
ncbi:MULTISPECIES: hypothetical protein [unclassified Brevundimonas]|uniref:hypothetical protein n=1 Tax=unclassified Brevundimonas TaxID=2622653 RepID=UPI0025B87C28|nr:MULTISPECIES: hypothetical protein [unclassified Brevundimonas]